MNGKIPFDAAEQGDFAGTVLTKEIPHKWKDIYRYRYYAFPR